MVNIIAQPAQLQQPVGRNARNVLRKRLLVEEHLFPCRDLCIPAQQAGPVQQPAHHTGGAQRVSCNRLRVNNDRRLNVPARGKRNIHRRVRFEARLLAASVPPPQGADQRRSDRGIVFLDLDSIGLDSQRAQAINKRVQHNHTAAVFVKRRAVYQDGPLGPDKGGVWSHGVIFQGGAKPGIGRE
ncbi:hypothetical protein [Pararhodobacter zhoushanensis]|uniref:Uncharacterized protein n=1 Tax=Pararhodobacter zhoushanensis TaxID=2479545 RepID=A0ABT3GTE8_9RHOB|nr:hypothetical protein [Pararhodobacter zhoushanensis]MCW1930791.1 hypothetical protein [Pararhodobacter zhoushanensis]